MAGDSERWSSPTEAVPGSERACGIYRACWLSAPASRRSLYWRYLARKVIHLWTGRTLAEPVAFQVLFGIYFLQMAWSHYWGVILIGLGRERLVSERC